MVEQDNKENNILFIDTLINKTKAPAKNILQSMLAELFTTFRENNRYKLYDRTNLVEEKSNDVSTWGINKLNDRIASLYKSSLQNDNILKSTSLNGLDAILSKGKNTRQLRPTLYDLLAHRALVYFMNDENSATQPAYKFILNDEKLFSPVNTFTGLTLSTKDSASLYFAALTILQDLLQFHAKDAKPDALADADLIRLKFIHTHGIFSDKDKLYEEALKKLETTYSNNPVSAQAMYLRAQLYADHGQDYNPTTKKENQFEIKKAIALLETVISKYPDSEGGINARNLLNQLKQPTLSLVTEKVNIPGQPFKAYVQYKNINRIYFRIIKTTRRYKKNAE